MCHHFKDLLLPNYLTVGISCTNFLSIYLLLLLLCLWRTTIIVTSLSYR